MKKTDLEKFVKLYKSFGIECKISKRMSGDHVIHLLGDECKKEEGETVTLSPNLDGDSYTGILFDAKGKFVKQGMWKE